ncbi:MAG: hypothetical protein ACT4PU_09620 [Planctomycetota bacterium]
MLPAQRRLLPCLALFALLTLLAGCAGPPPSHYTRLWPEGKTGLPMIGLSTEDGVLVLASQEFKIGDRFEIQFPVGNSLVRDWGQLERSNEHLAVVRPLTAVLREGRLARALPQPGEQIYLALRSKRDEPVMEEVELWRNGTHGDWILPPSGRSALTLAREERGAGLYVLRNESWEIVGLLAGLTAREEDDSPSSLALGFLGLGEIARILPGRVDYFEYDVRPLRPDFEFGVPLQPGDIQLDEPTQDEATPSVSPTPTPAPAPAPAPAPR